VRAQPRRARGTVEHPYSALTLRLVLASFGLVSCGVLAGLLWWKEAIPAAVVAAVFAAIAAVDIVVIQLRRHSSH
jgi:hypothetical protein